MSMETPLFPCGCEFPGFFDLFLIRSSEAALAQFDYGLLEIAGELERHVIVFADGRAGVLAAVERLIEREAESERALDAARGHRLAVHLDRAFASLAQAA